MNRTLKYALIAVLGATMVGPAIAQDNFPDVPENHWAYEALARMKRDGLLVGYPDGLFRGGRPASRYEMAVALHGLFIALKGQVDGLSTQIEEIRRIQPGTPADLQSLRDAVAALQNEVNTMRAWGNDIANLRRMTDTFQRELQSLGVDVEAMKKDLSDLSDRVSALEKRKPTVNISGDVNLWVGSGASDDNDFPINKDGRTLGQFMKDGFLRPAGHTEDLTVLHEAAITLAGTNDTGPTWRATLVFGNMLHNPAPISQVAFGNQSSFLGGRFDEGPADMYIQDLSIKFGTAVVGLGFNAEVGRLGYKISPYVFQRPDTTSDFKNERWDNGEWTFDGAVLTFNFGSAKLDVFGGQNSGRVSSNGVDLNPMVLGPTLGGVPGSNGNHPSTVPILGQSNQLVVDRSLGANLNVPLGDMGGVNLSYLFLDADNRQGTHANPFNRVAVLGATGHYAIDNLSVHGGFVQTNYQYNTSSVTDTDNRAFYGKLKYTGNAWSAYAGYRAVEALFAAPGDWGRLGLVRNPVNIQGFMVGGDIKLGSGLRVMAKGEFNEGKDNGFAVTGLDENSKVDMFMVGVNYLVAPNFDVTLSYEDTKFEQVIGSANDPKYRWTTLAFGYGLTENARLHLAYMISDVENDFVVVGPNAGRFKGGILTTQLSLRF